jgi:acetyl esterase/lipase
MNPNRHSHAGHSAPARNRLPLRRTVFALLILGAALSVASVGGAASGVRKLPDIEFARPGGVPLLVDLHLPADTKNPPLLMYIHGGGWRQSDRRKCKLEWLAEHGYAVASISYRFSQQALFPAQIHDCKGALRWLRAHAGKYGYDASRVVVAGSSAGGHLAALMGTSGGVAALEGDTAGHAGQSTRVHAVIDYYGASDFLARAANQPEACEDPKGSVYQLLGGKVSERQPLARLASPVTHITADDPPLLILHGELDDKVLPDQSEILRDRYRAAGLEVALHVKPGAGHGWTKSDAREKEIVLAALRRWLPPRP